MSRREDAFSRPIKIIVVDSDTERRTEVLQRLLPFLTVGVHSLESAEAMMRQNDYDIIIINGDNESNEAIGARVARIESRSRVNVAVSCSDSDTGERLRGHGYTVIPSGNVHASIVQGIVRTVAECVKPEDARNDGGGQVSA
jgi:hypothetical protein